MIIINCSFRSTHFFGNHIRMFIASVCVVKWGRKREILLSDQSTEIEMEFKGTDAWNEKLKDGEIQTGFYIYCVSSFYFCPLSLFCRGYAVASSSDDRMNEPPTSLGLVPHQVSECNHPESSSLLFLYLYRSSRTQGLWRMILQTEMMY